MFRTSHQVFCTSTETGPSEEVLQVPGALSEAYPLHDTHNQLSGLFSELEVERSKAGEKKSIHMNIKGQRT